MAQAANITERGSDGITIEKPIPASQPGDTFPAGALLLWPYTATPTGWLRADGTQVSRAGFPVLNAAAADDGYPDGAGDGSTTFHLPNYTDRSPIGAGNLYTRGGAYGEASTALTAANNGPHSHGGATQNNTSTTDAQGAHSHTNIEEILLNGYDSNVSDQVLRASGAVGVVHRIVGSTITNVAGSHAHNVASHGHGINSDGSGTPHNTVHPVRACYIIIRAY